MLMRRLNRDISGTIALTVRKQDYLKSDLMMPSTNRLFHCRTTRRNSFLMLSCTMNRQGRHIKKKKHITKLYLQNTVLISFCTLELTPPILYSPIALMPE